MIVKSFPNVLLGIPTWIISGATCKEGKYSCWRYWMHSGP